MEQIRANGKLHTAMAGKIILYIQVRIKPQFGFIWASGVSMSGSTVK